MSGKLVEGLGKTHINNGSEIKNGGSAPTDGSTIAIQLYRHFKPGIWTITLYEGVGLSTPDRHKQLFDKHQRDSLDHFNILKRLDSSDPAHHHPCLPYAILDFDGSQVSIQASSGTTENPLWTGDFASSCRFDVSRRAELTIYIYLKNTDALKGSQDIFLGMIKIQPSFDEQKPASLEWLDVQDGTGKIRVTAEYIETRMSEMADWKHFGTSIGVKKKDTRQLYAEKAIRATEAVSSSEMVSTLCTRINNPFIASLRLACLSSWRLHLFSPFVSGGHLFYYLQKERRFDIARSAFYAAELLSAFEHLHSLGIICNRLRPKNILLDSLGHIIVCDFGLFSSENKEMTVEYPAPESLIGKNYSQAADWWTLGIFLYEMLTGLPPFYDEDKDGTYRKILHEPVQFPESLPPDAKDVLTKLLDRKPEKRLEGNGAAEIKAHAFFNNIDWEKLLQRKYQPSFKPENVAMDFDECPDLPVDLFSGFTYNPPDPPKVTLETPSPLFEHSEEATKEEDELVLRWDEASQSFHFHNCLTNMKRPANVQGTTTMTDSTKAPTTRQPPSIRPTVREALTTHRDFTHSISSLPSQSQKRDALEAALKGGYYSIISQLMEYGMDLNIELLDTERMTPLEWATEHENVTLVKFFLDKGADANFPNFAIRGMHEGGPALIRAVKRGNQEIAAALVRKTDRVASTRALGLAIDQRDIAMCDDPG